MLWGAGFILAGLLLLLYPQLEKKAADHKQEQLIEAFEQLSYVSSQIDEAELPIAKKASVRQDAVELLDGARGVIRIPRIDLNMMIFEGSDESALRKGVGMIEPEKEFGRNNVGLAGHRAVTYGKQFNRLNELAPNDEIEIETKTRRYVFVVIKAFVVDRTKVEVLADQKDPLLTLVTCTPIGKNNPTDRLIVQAKLKSFG